MKLISKLATLGRILGSPQPKQLLYERLVLNFIYARLKLNPEGWFRYQTKLGFYFLVDRQEYQTLWMYSLGHPDIAELKILGRWAQLGDICFDVGANIGYMAALLANAVGKSGTVFAFEPGPKTFQILERNIVKRLGLTQVKPIQACIGSSDGVVKFFSATDPSNSPLQSMCPPESDSTDFLPVDVKLHRIDDLLTIHNKLIEPSLIKIDVEGCETQALSGAAQLIKSDNPPLFDLEINPECMTRTKTSISEITQHFGDHYELMFLNLSEPGHPLRFQHLVALPNTNISAYPRLGSLIAIPRRGAFAHRRGNLVDFM